MPLKFSAEELTLLHALAAPIEPRQREQFLLEVTAALEAAAERTGTGPVKRAGACTAKERR
jgi:hypothetical protein